MFPLTPRRPRRSTSIVKALGIIGAVALLLIPTYVMVRSQLAYINLQQASIAYIHAVKVNETAYMAKPVSIIGITLCDKLVGTIVVTGDGQLHEETDITPEQGEAISDSLPDGASVVARLPCAGGQSTSFTP